MRERGAYRSGHLRDGSDCWRPPTADRPNRLVSYNQAVCRRANGQRVQDLIADDEAGLLCLALGRRLADANDSNETFLHGCARFGADKIVRFTKTVAPLAVSDYHEIGTGFAQEPGRGRAGERAVDLLVAILCADPQARSLANSGVKQNGRRTDRDVHVRVGPRRLGDCVQFPKL